MILRYKKKDGTQMEFELGDRPITIGRSPEADLVILDEKASRLHAGIRMWDGDFILKDLRSKNGTYVNGQPVEMVKLNPGDRIRIGACVFCLEMETGKGAQTILKEVEDELSGGKGYTTLLREIIQTADALAVPAREPAAEPVSDETSEPVPFAESVPEPVRDVKPISAVLPQPVSSLNASDDDDDNRTPPPAPPSPKATVAGGARKFQVRIRKPIKK